MHIRPCFLAVVLFSVAIYSGCTTPDSIDTYVTATVKRQLFTSSIVVEGELEAEVARTLMVPRARMSQPPPVGFLAKEGTAVKKTTSSLFLNLSPLFWNTCWPPTSGRLPGRF